MEQALNLKQVARSLGVHYMTVYRYVRQRRLEAELVGTEWRVTPSALARFRDEREAPTNLRSEPMGIDWTARLEGCLLSGDEPAAFSVVEAALAAGRDATFCYIEMLSGALASIGMRWEEGELLVADQHVTTAVATRVVARLGARVRRPGRSRGTVVFGAPLGEFHSLPIAIAADLVRLAGFDALELGANVPAEAFATVTNRAPCLICVGIGVTTSLNLGAAQTTIDAIRADDATVPIILGGLLASDPLVHELEGLTAVAESGRDAVAIVESIASTRSLRRVV